jgi:regulator of replication initiation timing
VVDARDAIYDAPTAFDAQQALLDYADIYAPVAATSEVERSSTVREHDEKRIDDESGNPSQEGDLVGLEDKSSNLTNVVPSNRPQGGQQEAFRALNSSTVQEHQEFVSPGNASDRSESRELFEDKLNFLEARVRASQLENQDLEAKIVLFEENKKLTSKLHRQEIDRLETQYNILFLRSSSLDYNSRQNQAALSEVRKDRENELKLKDEQLDLLNIDNRTLQSELNVLKANLSQTSSAKDEQLAEAKLMITELESINSTWSSKGPTLFADLYKKKNGLTPDEWKDLVKSLTPKHHALLARYRDLEVQFEELAGKQEKTEAALREAQTEAWTKAHLHKEVCRTLELSQQMQKEANECAAISAEKFEALETRHEATSKVCERMLADSLRENSSKDERIKMLSSSIPSMHLKHILNDRQVELYDIESRLVATQRLIEALKDQLDNAKTKYVELDLENKNLECQLGEAKVRLDHDNEDEERLKEELETAKAAIEHITRCANDWQHMAVAELDKYTPELIAEMKDNALTTLQQMIDKANMQIKAMTYHNSSLETHLKDLEYELNINETRLAMDESLKINFYERHWSSVQEIFEENKVKAAMIKAFEIRFSRQLAKTPIETPAISDETFVERLGPEFIERSNALYRFIDEAREGRGEDDLRHSDLDQDRIKAIYGHGPAGYKPPPEKEMPEGYPARKAARDIADLKWQVKALKGRVWHMKKVLEGHGIQEGESNIEEEVEENGGEWEEDEEAMFF